MSKVLSEILLGKIGLSSVMTTILSISCAKWLSGLMEMTPSVVNGGIWPSRHPFAPRTKSLRSGRKCSIKLMHMQPLMN